jgi:hypothetical protein
MKTKLILSYFWKLPLCGLVYFIAMAVSGGLLDRLGFETPALPKGTDPGAIALWFVAGSMLLAFVLSFVAGRLRANWLMRWLILAELVWTFAALGMVIESVFFMNTDAVASIINAVYTLLSFLLPSLILALMTALLFPPEQPSKPCLQSLKGFFAGRSLLDWAWRLLLAVAAYPMVYFAFGLLVKPLVGEYYTQGMVELILPTWGQLIPLQLARSLLFLTASLPVIAWWRGSRRSLWVALGMAVFVLTAFMAVITSYWFPWQMRLFHGLELLADGLVYAGVLAVLFRPMPAASQVRMRLAQLEV